MISMIMKNDRMYLSIEISDSIPPCRSFSVLGDFCSIICSFPQKNEIEIIITHKEAFYKLTK